MIRKLGLTIATALVCLLPVQALGSDAVTAPSVTGSTVAKVVVPTAAYTTPGGTKKLMNLSTESPEAHGDSQFLVLESTVVNGEEWVRVRLPMRPNGTTGWVDTAYVALHKNAYRVVISTGHRTVKVYQGKKLVKSYRAVVGAPSTPTPTGDFAISESVVGNPHSFTGSHVILLTAFSNALRHFEGGPGRVAMHGRGGASLKDPLGSARSHGCVRLDNSVVDWMTDHLEPGTPVTIAR